MKKILSFLVLFPLMVIGQTQTENYIQTTTYKVPTATSITTPALTQASQNVTYFDGLGRPIQQIAHQQSGTGKDIVTPIEYDAFGRQTKEYLPYVPTSTASLDYKSTALTDVLNFPQYSGQNPFSEKLLEASPLNRVMKQAAPGTDTDWALGSGHEIKLDYQTNTAPDAVKLFSVTASWDAAKGLYDIPASLTPADYLEFQLYKTMTYDENTAATPSESNGSTVEFKNKEGQVVLKRTYGTVGTGTILEKHDTYYVYDQYGNLTFVVPPLVDAVATISNTILNDLCYQYKYDSRNRLVEKKLPGKQWEYIVYDKLDRVVATGPAFPPFSDLVKSGWMITKYDAYNRPVLTGWMSSAATINSALRKTRQDERDAQTTNLSESRTDSTPDVTISGITFRYSNVAIPTSGYHVLTVNYYDNYNYPNAPSIPTSIEGQDVYYNAAQKPIGLPTGSWIRAIKTSTSYRNETTYVLYDYKARPIRTFIKNHENSPGGYTQVDSKLDFSGKTLYTVTLHKRINSETGITIKDSFTYTDQDRLKTHTQQIGLGMVQLLTENSYDELGQLISKNVGNTTAAPLQKVDYAYNIRGWLTGINNDPTNNLVLNTAEKDLFAFKINYNTTEGNVASAKSLYNGNISETYYRTGSDNVLRKYGYEYDNLNRLKNAIYQKPDDAIPESGAYNESMSYDKNGNIKFLQRFGNSDAPSIVFQIDDLTYEYKTPNSNQLAKVTDSPSGNDNEGFMDANKSGDDYGYDANGNLITDLNKNITEIIYNHLNLPIKITFGTTATIEYLYDANGKKIEKIVTQGTVVTTTKYLEGFQYANDVLNYFPTAEGYVSKTGSSYKYVFNYTDHLGNIRLSYAKNATTGLLEILEENNYYPFGLKHSPSAVVNLQPNYKYKYNGKELQDELGLNTYDYGARNYDPALGRWMNIDPLAEEGRRFSPYNYGLNNPVFFIDPDGMKAQAGQTADIYYDWDEGGYRTQGGSVATQEEALAQVSGDGSENSGGQEDPKKVKETTQAEKEGFVSEQQRMNYEINKNLFIFQAIADGAAELSALLTIKSAFKLTSLSGLATKLLNKASKFTVASSKFDYFFGKVVTGNADNIRRSAQNLSDLTTLGIKTESDLIKVFNKAYNNSSTVKIIESSHGVSVIKSASVGTQGQAVQVSFFYKGGNMNVTPSVSSIIPKL